MPSDVISYFSYWHFINSWNQTGVLRSKQIPVFVIPIFMKVFSVTFNHEHQDCTACYKKTIPPYCSYDYVTVHTVLPPLYFQSDRRVTCNINSTCIHYKPYFTHPTLSACSRCTQHSSVRNPSATSSFTATNSKFFPLFYMKKKLIEKYKIYTFMCILILNLTILY